MPSTQKPHYFFAVGRRKKAVATVKLFSGKGNSTVNKIAVSKYFSLPEHQHILSQPLELTKTKTKYNFSAKITGGGKAGQAQALSLALARALQQADPGLRPPLKAAKLLTVDARVKQRRMVGTGGKARRQKQSPKR